MQRYFATQKIRSVDTLPAAVNLVCVNAVARGPRYPAGSSAIQETFRFIDADGSGQLNQHQIKDAFYALGVYLADGVVTRIMEMFDPNGVGVISYDALMRAMFSSVTNK